LTGATEPVQPADPAAGEGDPAASAVAFVEPKNLYFLVDIAWTALFLGALLLALWQQQQAPQRGFFLAINAWATQVPAAAWSFLTLLGETPVLFAFLSPLLLWQPQLFVAVLAAVPLGGVLSVALKTWASAPRPATLIDNTLFTIIGPLLNNASFPSGHTLTAFAAALALVAAGRRQGTAVDSGHDAGWARVSGAALVLLLAGLVGLSRIAVGAHWPVDVLAGAACGALAGQSGAWLAGRYPVVWQSAVSRFAIGQVMLFTALWLVLRPTDYPLGRAAIALAVACALATVVGQFVFWWRLLRRKQVTK
jgi:membrane-associated phospholipid phosphatase